MAKSESGRRPIDMRSALIGAGIGIALFIAVLGVGRAIYGTYTKVKWAFAIIDQLDPDSYRDLLPPPKPDRKDRGVTLADWVTRNLPPDGAKDYAAVGDVFLSTAEKLRRGEISGKAEAYAVTARELLRAVDRRTWEPFVTELARRAESETGDLADLFETVGKAIKGKATVAEPAEETATQDKRVAWTD